MTNYQLIRRLLYAIDDAAHLIIHLQSEKNLGDISDKLGCEGTSVFSNIQIAMDLNDDESDSWGDFSMDGQAMENIIREFGMQDQMLRQLMLKASDDMIEHILEERDRLAMKKYTYGVNSPSIWASFDFGTVDAKSDAEARELAILRLRADFEKANYTLGLNVATKGFAINFNEGDVLVKQV